MSGPVTRAANLTIHATITVTEEQWESGDYYDRVCDALTTIGVHVTTASAQISERFPAICHDCVGADQRAVSRHRTGARQMSVPDLTGHLARLRNRLTRQIDRQIRDRPPQPPITVRLGEADANLPLTVIDRALPVEPTGGRPVANRAAPSGVRAPETDRKRREAA